MTQVTTVDTMTATIRDRKAEDANWGHGPFFVHLVTVEIPRACLTCGGPTGEVYGYNGCEDGAYYHVDRWDNACGHVDNYGDYVLDAGIGAGVGWGGCEYGTRWPNGGEYGGGSFGMDGGQ